ncbi:aminopeptidase P N-terminal domain-containing protein [Natronosporangium hydrolyticum]|uniref:Xaa-Pro aminopeptidase n=1 Tax=Natronosporangium hydrolyticum TaxID=2811111 RepID=A0A895Y5N6_9ACTN|nr:aminopeptidase P family protein [Natronosporangium hydrolyticum]QSB13027.1 aminopeptidase P N-terminal domain-containing protein [Natronosporangium hydrolyticum]
MAQQQVAEGQSAAQQAPATGTESHDPDFPPRLLEFMRTGWRDQELPVSRRPEADRYAARRAAVAAGFPGETLVIPSGPERVRANDTNFRFRPGSDFVWLTGEHDPDSVLVLRPTGDGHDATLYVRPRSPRGGDPAGGAADEFFRDRQYGELWIGRRHTLAEKSAELGIETAPLAELPRALADCAPARTRVLRGLDESVDAAVRRYDAERAGARDRELAWAISELKLVKDEWEIAQLAAAVDATIRGFEDCARALPADRPVSERLIEGIFGLRARHDGNDVGYSSIVGSGANATILHWIRNDAQITPGQLLLADMGVEGHHLYTADVTRTLPVSGTFTPAQRELYDLVYAAQQAGLDAVKPGLKWEDLALTINRVLAEGLSGLGLLPGTVDEALEKDSTIYRRWTLHGFGHMLGIDVHDCAHARTEHYRKGAIDEGYVFTIEPGLYFQPEDELVPAELRGIGIRIEDDVVCTAEGAVNLSAGLPRQADEVESWLAAQRAAGPRLPG